MEQYILKNWQVVKEPDMAKYIKWFENPLHKVVSRTLICANPEIVVSTVFLGIDHSFEKDGEPVLFETMVFGGELNLDQDRYCTVEQAIAGHEEMCQKARQAQQQEVSVPVQVTITAEQCKDIEAEAKKVLREIRAEEALSIRSSDGPWRVV